MKYIVQFQGRQLGAIGKFELFTETVEAESISQVPGKINEKFQDIFDARIADQSGKVFNFFKITGYSPFEDSQEYHESFA